MLFELKSNDLLNGSPRNRWVITNNSNPQQTSLLEQFQVNGNTQGYTGIPSPRTIATASAQAVPFECSPGLGILALGACGAIAQLKSKVRKPHILHHAFIRQGINSRSLS